MAEPTSTATAATIASAALSTSALTAFCCRRDCGQPLTRRCHKRRRDCQRKESTMTYLLIAMGALVFLGICSAVQDMADGYLQD